MFIFNYENLIDPLLRDIRKFTPEFSGMKAGDRVLDVCCGTGSQVFAYGRRGIIATGIDISSSMLNIAARNKMKQGLVDVSFKLVDATNLPFADSSFDYASISFGLHDKEKEIRDRVISEMKRVVKQEGALILIDFKVPLPKHLWGLLARAIEFLVGGAHYRDFKDYLKQGGLKEILNNHKLREECREYLKGGIVVIIKAKNT